MSTVLEPTPTLLRERALSDAQTVPAFASRSHRGWQRLQRHCGPLLAGYWLLCYIATHVPMPPGDGSPPFGIPHFDKFVHFSIFCGLGTLFSLWRMQRRPQFSTRRIIATAAVVLAIYGGFDEISQAPVGRTPDWFDWFADLAGMACGIAIGVRFSGWLSRKLNLRSAAASRLLAEIQASHSTPTKMS